MIWDSNGDEISARLLGNGTNTEHSEVVRTSTHIFCGKAVEAIVL